MSGCVILVNILSIEYQIMILFDSTTEWSLGMCRTQAISFCDLCFWFLTAFLNLLSFNYCLKQKKKL